MYCIHHMQIRTRQQLFVQLVKELYGETSGKKRGRHKVCQFNNVTNYCSSICHIYAQSETCLLYTSDAADE